MLEKGAKYGQVNNKETRTRSWRRSSVVIVNFEDSSHITHSYVSIIGF